MAEPSVPLSAVRELVRRIHADVSQEAAAARVALAVWRRAVERGDAAAGGQAADEAARRLESLFDVLAALEAEGKRLIAEAELS